MTRRHANSGAPAEILTIFQITQLGWTASLPFGAKAPYAIIAADTGDSGFIAELTKLSCSLEEENADLKEALEKAKEFVQSWGELVDAHYSLQNQCMTKFQKTLAP